MDDSPKSTRLCEIDLRVEEIELPNRLSLQKQNTMKVVKDEPVKRLYAGGSMQGDYKTTESFHSLSQNNKGVSEFDKHNRLLDLSETSLTEKSFDAQDNKSENAKSANTERSHMYKELRELQLLNQEILAQNEELIKKNQLLVTQISKNNDSEVPGTLRIFLSF
jgi:hypothetical protein